MKILWDLDGTIVDTVPSLVDTFCIFAKKHFGIVVDRDVVDELTRIHSTELFAYYNIEYNDESVMKFREANKTILVEKTPLFDGIIEVLSNTELNVLVTNRHRKSTMEILEFWGIKNYFEEIICVDDGFPKKPDSSSYEYIHNKYGIDLVVGDRDLDLIPARKLGIKTCLYCNPSTNADYHVDNYLNFFKEVKSNF